MTSIVMKSAPRSPFNATTSVDPTAANDEEQKQRLESLPYYHRRLNRNEIEALLFQPGDFLLRKMSTTGRPVLSVKWQNPAPLHFPIQKQPEGYIFQKKYFDTIEEMINWHVHTKTPLTRETGVILKEPIPMASWELLTSQLIPIRKLCPGQFGDIYLGKMVQRQEGAVKAVVIKTMLPAGPNEIETSRDKFLQEARMLLELGDHQHIVRCFGFTVDSIDGRSLIANEFVPHGKLNERLPGNPPLIPKRKFEIITAAARALSYIHCHDFIHRFICARSFLIELNDQNDVIAIKLGGFRYAQRAESNIYQERPADAMLPTHLAIESLSAHMWTKRSDVWSWAVTVWEVFCNGARPYEGDIGADQCSDFNAVLQSLRRGVQLRPQADMNETLLTVWRQCFETVPDNRPTAYKIIHALMP